ncbi:MAG: hypothetical protein HC790_06835, partial [Acaryochloridaceae cyanobacterium CSU_3_4]|nr:hypothetical protein [Acaryochloridaceae cyanobacterium CSU_3_4]
MLYISFKVIELFLVSVISRSLNVNISATASFAQQRIFLDEELRFSHKVGIYNEPSFLQVESGKISVQRLQRALQSILHQHKILCTSLIFAEVHDAVMQCILDQHPKFPFATEQTFENQLQLQDIIHQLISDPFLFDLSEGRVFHCRILRRKSSLNAMQDDGFIRRYAPPAPATPRRANGISRTPGHSARRAKHDALSLISDDTAGHDCRSDPRQPHALPSIPCRVRRHEP